MKNLYHIFISIFVLCFSLSTKAQVISFNTQTLGTGYSGNNGAGGITFVIQNTNAFPAILNSVSNYFSGGGTGNFELYYSTTSLSGTIAGPINTNPAWTLISTASAVPVTAGVQTTVLSGLTFSIPGGAQYRFYLQGTGVTVTYTGVGSPTGATPTSFSNTGVNLQVGDYVIGGSAVGVGGLVNTPRAFTGSVGLTLLSAPCSGTPIAGTASVTPATPCPGASITASLTGTSANSGLLYQWFSGPSATGPWTLIGGATNSIYTTIPPNSTTTYYRCQVTCSGSGLSSFSNAVPVTVGVWSPTGSCWCVPTYASGGTTDNITNVVLGTLSNNTSTFGNPTPFYVDYTSAQSGPTATLSVPTLYSGLSATASITMGTDPSQYSAIWIDFNHDGNFSTTEYFSNNLNAGASGTNNITIIPPPTSLGGLTRMRVRAGDDVQMTSAQACGATNSTWGETEDYLVNIVPPSPYDPAVTAIAGIPAGNCYTANNTITATVCNYGTNPLLLSTDSIILTLNVTGPNGVTQYFDTLNSGLLAPYGGSCTIATFNNVDMYAGGNYSLNTGGLTLFNQVNGNLYNDSLANAITGINYRPDGGVDFPICQNTQVPFGQGLTVSGCATPILDSITINFTIEPPTNPTAANNPSGARLFATATGLIPTLPAGSQILSSDYRITNLATTAGGWANEARFPIFYGNLPINATTNLLYASTQGNPLTSSTNYTWTNIPGSVALGNIITNGQTNILKIGYYSTWGGNATSNGMTVNAGGNTTVASLKIRYQYVPASYEWYNTPTGGSILYTYSPFDPITTPSSGISNSSVPGTFPFYVACAGSSGCRDSVRLIINPAPIAVQDTISVCELQTYNNSSVFDLTTVDGPVSNNDVLATVEYYGDQSLTAALLPYNNYLSGSSIVYSKVSYAPASGALEGCFATDTVLLQVNSKPDFGAATNSIFACAPNSVDVANSINAGATTFGADTTYWSDPALTIPFPNPHSITVADTVYMLFTTNTDPACMDTSITYVDVTPASGNIVNQYVGGGSPYYSTPGYVGCYNISLTDGTSDTLRSTTDCTKTAGVTDAVDGIDLGTVAICEDIATSTLRHNSQPYMNRSFEITPTNDGPATVCLFVLNDDVEQYNAEAATPDPITGLTYLPLPTAANPTPLPGNIAITQVDNGDLNTPGHIPTLIPPSSITASYDATAEVWTYCFPVDSFSFFYIHSMNANGTPLPIDVTFTGAKVNDITKLSWITQSEKNNNYFEVERSRNGQTYTTLSNKIATKAVGGNSNTLLAYSYDDNAPMQGHNYYRLKQTDLDNKVSYAKEIVDIYYGNGNVVTMYPNPVNTALHVDINIEKATAAKIKLLDATGRIVRLIDMQLKAGINTNTVDMSELADGIYMLEVTNGKGLQYSQTIRKN